MAVQIGKGNNSVFIYKNVVNKIFSSVKQYKYETGGIIGVNKNGEIVEFQFDNYHSPNLFEYSPNICFLNRVINEKWKQQNIEFAGFVHSHLNNSEISQQDIEYAREVLSVNKCVNGIILGIVMLNEKKDFIKWYQVGRQCLECKNYIEK